MLQFVAALIGILCNTATYATPDSPSAGGPIEPTYRPLETEYG